MRAEPRTDDGRDRAPSSASEQLPQCVAQSPDWLLSWQLCSGASRPCFSLGTGDTEIELCPLPSAFFVSPLLLVHNLIKFSEQPFEIEMIMSPLFR